MAVEQVQRAGKQGMRDRRIRILIESLAQDLDRFLQPFHEQESAAEVR